jgi:hypothetical protein
MIFKYRIITLAVIGLISVAVIQSCNQTSTGTASGVTPPTPATVVSTNMCTSATTKIIDYGERALVATAGVRGAFSDIALNPVNNYPGFVFDDAGSLTLKFMYWDGTKYNFEIVSGGLTYQFVKVVYLTDGRPLVFWTNGATAIYMASRSTASVSAVGTWTVTAIDNVATTTARSVEATVSPANQVGVFYVNAAGTAARVILCNANCETASNYSGMGVVGNFITNTASATANSSDIKFCNVGGGVYHPYVVYPGTVNSIIARCQQASLTSCLTPANWANTGITDGTNATGVNALVAKLQIDPGAPAAFNVVARRTTGTEIRAYQQATGNCSTGALTFSATSRLVATGAAFANAYGSLTRDSSNRWHLMINDGTTAINYYNELTGNILSAWNTVNVVQTTTIGGAGATRGGMVVDSTNDQVLLTYGRTASGTPTQTIGNNVLAYSNCPVGGTGCLASTLASPSSAAGLTFGNTPLDVSGQVQLLTAQLPNAVSVAVSSLGRPAVAFIDNSIGSATTGRLKYRYRNGPLTTDAWSLSVIGTASSPHNVSMAFDHNNRPWIAYYDANPLRYFLVTNDQTDGSGVWVQYQFPVAAATAATLPAVNNVALAMAYTGTTAKPIMFISNSGAATKIVRSAIFDLATSSWSANTLIDTGTNNFSKMTADFDKTGKIVVAYHDTTNTAIRYSQSTNGGTVWTAAAAVITGVAGQGLELKLNPVSGLPAIAYYDRANNLVRYRYCTSAFATCDNTLNWANLGTGIVESTAGVSTLTALATDGLLSSSLTFSLDGYPWILYTGGAAGNGNLNLSTTSSTSTLFSGASTFIAGSNANITTPVVSTPANFGVGGWNATSVRSSATGSLHTAFIGPGNYLYMTSCGD